MRGVHGTCLKDVVSEQASLCEDWHTPCRHTLLIVSAIAHALPSLISSIETTADGVTEGVAVAPDSADTILLAAEPDADGARKVLARNVDGRGI
jgi:hypothetical protein